MTDQYKYTIRLFYERSDYYLWWIHVRFFIYAKGLEAVLSPPLPDTDPKTLQDKNQNTSYILVVSLSYQALRVVRAVIYDPLTMLTKLDQRYYSNTTA